MDKSNTSEKQQNDKKKRREPLIRNSSLWTNREEADPMGKFRINSTEVLDLIDERILCERCHKSRKYYCYTCYVPMNCIKSQIPFVRLPVRVDIIKHVQEVDGKSTSSHAAIIAPKDVNIYAYPEIPDWTNEKVILVFPGPNAKSLTGFFDSIDHENSTSDSISTLPFDRVVFIDSTWRQTKRISSDERIKDLPSVMLASHNSLFWRHQQNTPLSYLSTIEAIYYFFVDLYNVTEKNRCDTTECSKYDGRYDNLLFFFKHTYNRLRKRYNI